MNTLTVTVDEAKAQYQRVVYLVYRDLRHHAYPGDGAREALDRWGVPEALLQGFKVQEGLSMGELEAALRYCKEQVWDTVEGEETSDEQPPR